MGGCNATADVTADGADPAGGCLRDLKPGGVLLRNLLRTLLSPLVDSLMALMDLLVQMTLMILKVQKLQKAQMVLDYLDSPAHLLAPGGPGDLVDLEALLEAVEQILVEAV